MTTRTVLRSRDQTNVGALRALARLAVFAGLLLLAAHPALAQSWNGTTSDLWSDGTNWQGGIAPSGSDTVSIVNTPNNPVIINSASSAGVLILGSAANSLNIENAASLTINGGPINESGGSINLLSGGNSTDLILAGGGTINLEGTGNLTMSNNPNNRIYATTAATFWNVQNTISGAGQIGSIVAH